MGGTDSSLAAAFPPEVDAPRSVPLTWNSAADRADRPVYGGGVARPPRSAVNI